jgi:aryl-alcohol dehydrogenase-like predicted oxidoreductase
MERVSLGSSNVTVGRLGMGCWPIGGHGWGPVDDKESLAAVRRAYEGGIDFFDTADVYGLGHSEAVLAEALGDNRRHVVIATKVGVRWNETGRTWIDNSPAYLRRAIQRSLKRLRLETLPLCYVHWHDGTTPVVSILEELEDCRRRGLVRCIGLSNFTQTQVEEALSVAPVHALQLKLNLLHREALAMVQGYCMGRGIAVVTWGSLADGLLTGKYRVEASFAAGDHRWRNPDFQGVRLQENLKVVERLVSTARRYGATAAQAALRWLLDTPGISSVLCGARTGRQIEENLGCMGWKLSREDHEHLAGCVEAPGAVAAIPFT